MSIIISIVNYFIGLATEIMSIIRDNTAESRIPDEVIRDIARALLPDIIAFFESEKDQAEFAEWKAEQGRKSTDIPNDKKSEV